MWSYKNVHFYFRTIYDLKISIFLHNWTPSLENGEFSYFPIGFQNYNAATNFNGFYGKSEFALHLSSTEDKHIHIILEVSYPS